jgi:hypothetical protein
MGNDERSRLQRYGLWGGLVGLAGVAVWLGFASCTRLPTSHSDGPDSQTPDNVKQNANDTLAKEADFNTCRGTLDQLNTYLARHDDENQLPESWADERARLRQRFGLNDDELAEIESRKFTRLDAHYLDLCLLLRDAARSLDLKPPASLWQAQAAFAWVIRQVRLRAGEGEPLPPAFVLRRGWGTAQERALVFVTLLHQLRIPGCILALPSTETDQPRYRYWLPGALLPDPDGHPQIYLFDTRLGLPLPGPKGGRVAVATLAQVRSSAGGALLAQLTADAKHPYDLTPAQAGKLEVHVACPLSALAPRMRYLQTEIFDANTVQLAADARPLLEQFDKAVHDLGVPVQTWQPAMRAWRRFLPAEEGGADQAGRSGRGARQARAEAELIPLHVMPGQVAKLPLDLRERLINDFFQGFRNFYLGPGRPRDRLLRGRFNDASQALVALRDELEEAPLDPQVKATLEKQVDEWCQQVNHAYADLIRAEQAAGSRGAKDPDVQDAQNRMEKVWQNGARPLNRLLLAARAEPFGPEVTYQLALCKHEEAERVQGRLRRAGGGPAAKDAQEAARIAWQDAVYWWAKYEEGYPLTADGVLARLRKARQIQNGPRPEAAGVLVEYLSRDLTTGVSARLLHARALEHLGERDAAVGLLEGFARELRGVEETEDLLGLVEQPDQRGSVLWLLTGLPVHVQQLRQAP